MYGWNIYNRVHILEGKSSSHIGVAVNCEDQR